MSMALRRVSRLARACAPAVATVRGWKRESAATMMLDSPPVGMTIPSDGSTRAGGVSARDGGALGESPVSTLTSSAVPLSSMPAAAHER